MKLNKLTKCRVTKIENGRLHLSTRRVFVHKGPHTAYSCGEGAKAAGFSPNGWVFRAFGKWYVRPAGTRGQRGEYSRIDGCWTTNIREATADETRTLDNATKA